MTPERRPLRGQIYMTELRGVGRKPLLVVSNNRRNQALPSVIAARVTTAKKPQIPSIVDLPHGEAVDGRVICDDLHIIPIARLLDYRGVLSRPAMAAVDFGLRDALGLS